jgi:hypothetical protein
MNRDSVWRDLAEPWWRQRSHPAIRPALIKPLAKFWKHLIDERLAYNRRVGSSPKTLREVAEELGINEANLFRKRQGKTNWDAIDVLTVARSLGLSVGDLYPSFDALLIEATLVLCSNSISQSEARLYVAYRLSVPKSSSQSLESSVISQVHQLHPQHSEQVIEQIVWKVAELVGNRLRSEDRERSH